MSGSLTHRVKPGEKLKLDDIDPDDTGPYKGKDDPRAIEGHDKDLRKLTALQERLYAEEKRSLLVVLQAPDTAGKDGVLRKVVGPLDSRGVYVWSFKQPTAEELSHDFLWRIHQRAPSAGRMTFFNRSHYEDVLIARVLDLVPKHVWSRRYEQINAFEALLHDSGTRVVKFYLHISKAEQKKRLQERLDDPDKRWKFQPNDLKMRARWDDFREAYEDALSKCSTEEAPWHVVPANAKWYRDIAVARTMVEVLEDMDPKIPAPSFDPAKIVID